MIISATVDTPDIILVLSDVIAATLVGYREDRQCPVEHSRVVILDTGDVTGGGRGGLVMR